MKIRVWILCVCLAPLLARAADGACAKPQKEMMTATAGGFLACPDLVQQTPDLPAGANAVAKSTPPSRRMAHPTAFQQRDSALSAAIASAAKKGFIEAGVEASANALIACQNEKSVVLTTPSLRSDSQQAHCFRF